MATLAELGVQVQKSRQSSATTLQAGNMRVDLASQQTTRLSMTLPKDCGVRASFRKESWGDAVVKLFKKEIQTGDAEFDKLVYISTDTTEATKAFLSSADVRGALALAIETGGPVEIDGAKVVAHSPGHDDEEDRAVVTIVTALLGA